MSKEKLMDAPWTQFNYHQSSMGWRMGPGEVYLRKWESWFSSLTSEEQSKYRLANPEPDGWFYAYELSLCTDLEQQSAILDKQEVKQTCWLECNYQIAKELLRGGDKEKAKELLILITNVRSSFRDAKVLLRTI